MVGILDLTLRLVIWFLLTSDLSLANILIGVAVALILPRSSRIKSKLRDWAGVLKEIILAIPKAYVEAFQIMLAPYNHSEVKLERVRPNRTPGLIFLDIFVITFTPKTIVLKYREDGWYEVHNLVHRKAAGRIGK
ncbi:Na+/H+ antiporter subunit E [Thermosynechococcaceae cyanobacterium BACA0444]|uniref:Na+/H+ antiporter subunit E n=1 Tax=Pseudocalidococcus azoricus BACA0444 TaxID=2918990 RepID=A0AAE4FT28_9CYAN|nr:Na+/H+ antiporter subunit E [Pseudocalidococcus azoricus]MDS3860466.1 Na+/H+ antiporter subunit E [Pseudocalidococcus azoricus BACA0444]